ncbi:MAG: VCBS repeat-containing protein [bacterium]
MMNCILAAIFFIGSAGPVFALEADAVVVKVDSDTVYFDITGSSKPVSPGSFFTIFSESGDLFNPLTGTNLGKMIVTVATGSITLLEPRYAVGTVTFKKSEPKPGHKVSWTQAPPKPAKPGEGKTPFWRSAPLEDTVIGLAAGDVDGDGEGEISVISANKLTVYSLNGGVLKAGASWEAPAGQRLLSVEAADLKKTGMAQIFVSQFSDFSKRAETAVLELKDGKLKKTAALNWLVRGFEAADGLRLYAQELFESSSLDRSAIRRLIYREGKFTGDSEPLKKPRPDWLYGFSLFDMNSDSIEDLVYVSDAGRIRVQFKKRSDHWETESNDFGKTPVRFTWIKKILKVYPGIPVFGGAGQPEVCGVVNIPRSGILADSFGLYKSGELRCFAWSGTALKEIWKAPVEDGFITDIRHARLKGLPEGLLISAAGISGRSFLMLFEP